MRQVSEESALIIGSTFAATNGTDYEVSKRPNQYLAAVATWDTIKTPSINP
jgi:hypothetical protein